MFSCRARCTPVLIVNLDSLLNQYLARIDRCITGSPVRRNSAGLDPPASEFAIFAMAERTSYDDSLAAALESDPLPPDEVTSGAEGLPLVPSGSLSPTTSSPPAGVLQTAASNENDEHLSEVPS
jgi:hypothetical protein